LGWVAGKNSEKPNPQGVWNPAKQKASLVITSNTKKGVKVLGAEYRLGRLGQQMGKNGKYFGGENPPPI